MEQKTIRKEKGNYVFPNTLASIMKKVSMRTQYEASMMSIAFILFGIIIMAGYVVFFLETNIFVKIMTSLNALAGFIFLSSNLIATFQQYRNYLAVVGVLKDYEDAEIYKFEGGKQNGSNIQNNGKKEDGSEILNKPIK